MKTSHVSIFGDLGCTLADFACSGRSWERLRSHFGSSRTLRPAGSLSSWPFGLKLSLFVRIAALSFPLALSLLRGDRSSSGHLEHITGAERLITDIGGASQHLTVFGPTGR